MFGFFQQLCTDYTITSCCTTFLFSNFIFVYFLARDPFISLKYYKMILLSSWRKKASLQARKRKLKLFQNQKLLSILVKNYQFCLPSITTNIKDLLKPLTQQMRETNDFLNLHTKCIDPELNLNNALSDIICDQDYS